jgi:uncharacterized iron-regulated protein
MTRLTIVLAATALAVVPAATQGRYVPERVVATAPGVFTDFEAMVADVAGADVVLVGEQHDDPNTHALELALLEGLLRRRGDLVLSLEMFERDVQGALDRFRAGALTEADFLEGARPWPRYATDYKALVDLAVAHGWPVVAANVPRAMASDVAREGTAALEGRPDAERAWFAADLECPTEGAYFDRFVAAMAEHPADPDAAGEDTPPSAEAERYYLSQCLKDETMAESIARVHGAATAAGQRPLVVHVTGAFHADYRLGTAERVVRRMPDARVVVVTIVPTDDLDDLAPAEDLPKADYVVYTLGRRESPHGDR